MLPLVLPRLLLAIGGAPDLDPYLFDPVDIPTPSWTSALGDSVRPERPVAMHTVVHDTAGRVIGRDTMKLALESSGFHTRTASWHYGNDTTLRIRETWDPSREGLRDSGIWLSCRLDSCATATRIWTVITAQGRLTLTGHSQRSDGTYLDLDSVLRRYDHSGRLTFRHAYFHSLSSQTDSVEWGVDAPTLWISEALSNGVVVKERHHPSWDGTRLLRDSVWRRTIDARGAYVDTTILRGCSWDGPRILSCFTLPDSHLTSLATWSPEGRPLLRVLESGEASKWNWDERGRLVRDRVWGTETDLASIEYGAGDLPVSAKFFSCSEMYPFDNDICVMKQTRAYEYSIPTTLGSARIGHRRGLAPSISGGQLLFQGLSPEVARVTLLRPDGRIVSSRSPSSGVCTFQRPPFGEILLYGIFDANGNVLAEGRTAAFR